MKKSLVFLKPVVVEKDKFNKIYTDEGKMDTTSDIPFIRYRFERYTEEELRFMRSMQDIFDISIHMIEVTLNEYTEESLKCIKDVDDMAIYIYVPADDQAVAEGLSEETLSYLEVAANYGYDRIMIRDISNDICLTAVDRIKDQIVEVTSFELDSIGVCSSPLSFRPDQSCLSAIHARELATIYSKSDQSINPSANHESMTSCGCIQHILVDSPLTVDSAKKDNKANNRKSGSSNTGSKKEKKTEPKKSNIPEFLDF